MSKESSNHRCRRADVDASGVDASRLAPDAVRRTSDIAQRQFTLAWLLLPLFVIGTQGGCSVYHLAKRTMHCELNEYPQVTDGKQACKTYQSWAKEEWQRVQAESGESLSNDYASGFLQGFVDQVKSGGEPIPPPVPPRKYWRIGYRNERGRRAVEHWYNGFEHGARVADEGGYRDRAVVPSSLYASAEPRSEMRRDEPTEAVPMEPTPAERPEPLSLPVTVKPIQDDKAIEVADASDESPAVETGRSKSASEKPRSVIPVVFERPDSEPRQVRPAWGDKPPAPPWHADAQSESGTMTRKDAAGEFDPYDGSIITGPNGEVERPDEGDAQSSAKASNDTSDGTSTDDSTEPAFTEKRVDKATDETSDDSDKSGRDAASKEDQSATEDEGWQSKHEPTEWKSRR